jgi:hypothetical protein
VSLAPKPKNVVSIVIDASLSPSTGRDFQQAEQRLAASGFPIRINSTLQVVDLISFSNTSQRKTEFSALAAELEHANVRSAVVDAGLETLNDTDCLERNRCEAWTQAQAVASAHDIKLSLAPSAQEHLHKLLADITAVPVNFTLKAKEVADLTEAAHWVAARRVVELCQSGIIKTVFHDSDACKSLAAASAK